MYLSFKLNLKSEKLAREKLTKIRKKYQRKFISFGTIGIRNSEHKIVRYLKLKKMTDY